MEGYEKVGTNECRAKKNTAKMQLYFTHIDTIYKMDVSNCENKCAGGTPTQVANATAASGLDFHYKRRLLFFTDTNKRKVYQLRLDSTGTKTLSRRDYRCILYSNFS